MKYIVDLGVLGEVELNVEYDYSPGRHATYDDPPEPCELTITNLLLPFDDLHTQIIEYLCDDDNFLQEVHEREVIDVEAARADHYNDMKREREAELWT